MFSSSSSVSLQCLMGFLVQCFIVFYTPFAMKLCSLFESYIESMAVLVCFAYNVVDIECCALVQRYIYI